MAWVVPMAQAVYDAGGDLRRLAKSPELIDAMLSRVRENLSALRALEIPVTPARLYVWFLPGGAHRILVLEKAV